MFVMYSHHNVIYIVCISIPPNALLLLRMIRTSSRKNKIFSRGQNILPSHNLFFYTRSIFSISPTSRRAVGVQKHLFVSERAILKRATKTKNEHLFVYGIIV